ncbi:MAG TPA: VWA domain-containing protein, partial [Acidimicrobiales bacterium]
MRFANPAGLALLALAVPIVVLHILRPRRPPVTVSSTWLWREVAKPVSAAAPWQRLRPSVLLALQLAALVLLAGAVARPVRVTDAPLAAHTIFVVDASGSMAATDGDPDRLADAKDEARRLRGQLPSGGVASIVVAAPQPRVVLSTSADRRAFDDALRPIRATPGGADFATAFTLAASLETPGTPIGVVLLSDGGLDDDGRRSLLPGTRYVRVGDRSTNRAITRLVVEPAGSGLRALVSVRNAGGPAVTQTLRIDVDGRTRETLRLRLARNATVERQVALPSGDRVEAFLEGEDLLTVDNRAVAVAARRPAVRVLMAGPGNPFLEALLASIPGVTIEKSAASRPAPGFDLAIYDRVAVPADPGAAALAIAPPAGAPGVTVVGSLDHPAVTLVQPDEPLLRDLDLSGIVVEKAQKVEAPGDQVVAGAEGGALLLRGTRHGRPFAYLTFALEDSDLPLQVAFPVIGDRLLTELAGAALPAGDIRVGQALPVPAGATVREPGGSDVAVAPGSAVVAERVGFHVVRQQGRPDRLIAVNADASEADVAPEEALPVPEPAEGDERAETGGEAPVLGWLIAALIAVMVAETLVARRRVGVGRRQWRGALVLRGVVALLCVLALAGVALPRPGKGVATVFLVDASASMGASGRAEAVAWVRDAVETQPRDARAGVAFFGGDARLESTVQRRARLVQPSTTVDSSRTNLANALRLAAAVLPSDARRRVVVVSDGRATDGDARAEADRLRRAGIEVDVHAVDRTTGRDAAVARLDAPTRAGEGDTIALRGVVVATHAGAARVTLERDGAVVDERLVDLVEGENVVEFAQPALRSGTARFTMTVSSAGDTVRENDGAHAGVQVDGPSRVVLVEGATGDGSTMAEALRASGLVVDVVAATALPPLDRLAGYEATILVDVDARSLTAEQVAGLGAATRDLGRGLVVVGGTRSYALGGYRDSALEELLPVISDITDPKRRQSVAEVLAIDTSGSMGACHCAEGAPNGMVGGGNRENGGVNKTDISRAGAARAIEALSEHDLVGVLAFNTDQEMVVPLQKVPPEDVVTEGLRKLAPAGSTDVNAGLTRAAKELRNAKAKLKHVILFTDGFTEPGNLGQLERQAGELAAEGITVSVVATGEGATRELERVAKAGKGRFYPGRDLNEIPQILMQEAVLASRNFVNEGSWYPKVTGGAEAVRDLRAAPPLLGYVAATSKPTATTDLRLGDEDDPLLASWTVGIGRATAWTSDASARWSKQWAGWDGYSSFWGTVVRETFSANAGGASLRATIEGDRLRIVLEGAAPWADGVTSSARVSTPDGRSVEVPLERTAGATFAGDLPATGAGSYAVGATVSDGSGTLATVSALANQSYAPEY